MVAVFVCHDRVLSFVAQRTRWFLSGRHVHSQPLEIPHDFTALIRLQVLVAIDNETLCHDTIACRTR
jgi:hypothetical protein